MRLPSFVRRPLAVTALSSLILTFAACGIDAVGIVDNGADGGPVGDSGPSLPPGSDGSVSTDATVTGDASSDAGVDAALDAPLDGDADLDASLATDGDADAGPPPIVYGLDARPANPTCKAFTAPPTTGQVQLVDKFPNVPLNTPTGLFQRPNDNTRWYATERGGRILHFPNTPTATAADVKVALDLHTVTMTASDCSMSSIAFPADFATSKRAYVGYCYNGPDTANHLQVRVSRFTSNDGGGTFDPASEQVILALDHPYDAVHPTVGLHTSDAIRFGKDGYLYVAIGDGGPQGKIGGQQAQDKTDLRGKLLRLDVSDFAKSLSKDWVANRQRIAVDIPPDNPFVAAGGNGTAIYAYGFRNPWQWHFDRTTNAIWLGDVGNASWEEVDRDVQKGGNYGWSIFEGSHCTGYFGAASCNDPTLIPPLLDYSHGSGPQQGNAITGGIVYRGSAVPSLTGAYIFGDSSAGRIWAVRNVDAIPAQPAAPPAKELLFEGAPVSSFDEDQDGEIYLTILYAGAGYTGRVLSLEEVLAGPGTGGPPALLSDTGCFDKNNPSTPVAGVVPFAPSAELYSDGASKRRWFALPDGQQIAINADGDFDFPPGSVLMKEFTLHSKKVETRFFVRQEADSRWAGYTYVWNDAQTDATLQGQSGTTVNANGQTWVVPSRAQCFQCHTKTAGTTLGPEIAQLNHDVFYPDTGRVANQLTTLAHVGIVGALPPDPLPSLAAIGDLSKSTEERARAYLHANCSNCHRPEGPTFTPLDLRYSVALKDMGMCNVPPTIDSLESYIPTDPRLFAPGDPNRSVLYWRMHTTDTGIRMPPLGRTVEDTAGVTTIASWITTTTMCPP